MTVGAVANFAGEILGDFVRNGRPKSHLKFADFFEDYIFTVAPLLAREANHLKTLESLMRIFGAAAFLRWKHVDNFDLDAIRIAEKMILPINSFYRGSNLKTLLNYRDVSKGKIVYLTNFDPLNFNGVATCFSVYNLVDSFADYAKTYPSVSMRVFLTRPDLQVETMIRRHVSESGNELTIHDFRAFASVIAEISRDPPEYLFLDYFTYPNNLVPFLFPQCKVVYFGFGFSLFVFSGTRAIVTQERTPHIDEFLVRCAPELSNRFACPPRIHGKTPNLAVRLSKGSVVEREISDFRASWPIVFGSLCRSGKVSDGFIDAVQQLLVTVENSAFLIAGDGCDQIGKRFRPELRQRVKALSRLPSAEVLSRCDVYLETFPEHQGLAVVEAMKFNLPVVYLNDLNNPHTLLSERAFGGCTTSVAGYVDLARRLGLDKRTKLPLVREQRTIMDGKSIDAHSYWAEVFRTAG